MRQIVLQVAEDSFQQDGRLLFLKEVTTNNFIQADRWLIPTRHGRSNEDSLFPLGLRRDSGEQRGPNAAPVTSTANKERSSK